MTTIIKDKIWFHKSKENCRWWLHWGKTCWHYEGYLFKNARHSHIGVDLGGDENDIQFCFGIKWLFNVYFGIEDFFPRKMMNKLFGYVTRNYGISIFDEYISVEFHRDDMGLSKGWKGYHKMINWKNILFGKVKYESKDLSIDRATIKMPEGDYEATVRTFQSTWIRKRFVKPKTLIRYDITPDIPIPEPGKGESGWDLEDDALISTTVVAKSLDEALRKVSESVMKTRIKRAGENWIPDKGFSV